MADAKLAWGKAPRSSQAFDTRHEIGDRCPNCDWPTDTPPGSGVFAEAGTTPTSVHWTCSHCGWEFKASYHEPTFNNQEPGAVRTMSASIGGRAF